MGAWKLAIRRSMNAFEVVSLSPVVEFPVRCFDGKLLDLFQEGRQMARTVLKIFQSLLLRSPERISDGRGIRVFVVLSQFVSLGQDSIDNIRKAVRISGKQNSNGLTPT